MKTFSLSFTSGSWRWKTSHRAFSVFFNLQRTILDLSCNYKFSFIWTTIKVILTCVQKWIIYQQRCCTLQHKTSPTLLGGGGGGRRRRTRIKKANIPYLSDSITRIMWQDQHNFPIPKLCYYTFFFPALPKGGKKTPQFNLKRGKKMLSNLVWRGQENEQWMT